MTHALRPTFLAVCLLALASACAGKPEPQAGAAEPTAEQPEQQAEPEPADPNLTGILGEEAFAALHELTEAEAPPPKGETIDLAGTKAYLSLPEGASAPLPAVVVIHEWWGLNDHIRHWTDRLAADGYAALAVDLYGGEVASDPDTAMKLMKAVDAAKAQAILTAAHDYLAQDPRIEAEQQGVIGWCFGGHWSLQHAIATPDLDAAVIYYGQPITDPEQLTKIEAPLLAVYANQDESIPPKAVDAFVKALEGVDKSIEVHRYDANHAFANPSSARYQQEAAADAWTQARAFLAEHLKHE
jgi:carboxymethylenebutenolidase